MPVFGTTGTQYDPQTANQLTQALQGDPWRQQAQQRKAAIQARGGQWAPDDYQFFGVDPSRMNQHWKDTYLNNIDQLAAQGITQRAGAGNFNTGIYNIDNGKVGQRKSFVDSPLGKALVLGPMIAGGGLAASAAIGGGGAGAAEVGDITGELGSSTGTASGGLAELGGEAGGELGGAGGAATAGDITGELGASTGTSSGGVPEVLGGTSKAGSLFGGAAGSKLLPTLLNAGMRLGGAAYGAHAAGQASQQQQQNIQKALDLQKSLYGQSQAALMPYYQMGAGSLGRLQSFLGTPSAAPLPSGTLGNLGK